MKIFGFEIKRPEQDQALKSFVEPDDADGSLNITAAGPGAFFGTSYVDMEGAAKNEAELISKYRQMEQHPEVAKAIEDIVNEAIVVSDDSRVVDVNLDDTDLSDKIKKMVIDEFQGILELLDFSNKGYEVFNRWYVDGRIRYHVIVDEKNIKDGIQELRYIDPRKLRKVKEIAKAKEQNVDIVLKKVKNEYWIFNDKGFVSNSNTKAIADFSSIKGVKIAKDSIVECNSGILNENNTLILSHLHKAIKPHNQLRMLEDAAVIYRLSRAPERRVFYIDVGNLPKMKAEQYLRDMMVKHKNRLVYDATTGEIRDDRRHMTMMEDFWLPRREGGRGTEITTLPGGQNLGEMDDVMYFQKNLYKALNVPISRLEPETGFSLGRASEISRDEVKFSKFIGRLRARFSILFDEILEKQLILKNIMTIEEWQEIKNKVRYDFQMDNHYEELKQAEILRERLQTMRDMEDYVGVYYSREWIRKNILMQTDDDIEKMNEQIAAERESEPDENEQDINNDSIDTQDNEGV